jgi:hypothetical protein
LTLHVTRPYTKPMAVVYWLFDETCPSPWEHGYVGVTVNIRGRLKWHRARRGNRFDWRILFEGSESECYAFENKMRPGARIGWNIAWGGECGGGRHPRSEETRQRMREAALRRYADPAERTKMSEATKGRSRSPEHCARISAAKKGTKMPWIAEANRARTGRKLPPRTPENRAKISAAKKGMKCPWVADARRGTKATDETRAKLSAAVKRMWVRRKKDERGA